MSAPQVSHPPYGMAAAGAPGGGGRGGGRGGRVAKASQKEKRPRCDHCRGRGHVIYNCRHLKRELQRQLVRERLIRDNALEEARYYQLQQALPPAGYQLQLSWHGQQQQMPDAVRQDYDYENRRLEEQMQQLRAEMEERDARSREVLARLEQRLDELSAKVCGASRQQ